MIRLDDPFLRFQFAVVRRDLARFESRLTAEAWADARETFASRVLGPHFEQLSRSWTERHASATTLGGRPSKVGVTQLKDAAGRSKVEIDVVAVTGNPNADRPRVLAIGEAKGGTSERTLRDLRKLDRAREMLEPRADVSQTRLLLFSLAGFDPSLREVAKSRRDVELVDLDRLYQGT